MGDVYRAQQKHREALHCYQRARSIAEELDLKPLLIPFLSGEGMAHLGLDEKEGALSCSARAMEMLEGGQISENPHEVYFNHYHILAAHGRDAEAIVYLQKAHGEVMQRADGIKDAQMHESFLENVKLNREILAAWEASGRAHG